MKLTILFIVIIAICMNLLVPGIDKFYSRRGSSSQEQKMTPESVISSSSKDVSESSLVAPTPKRSLSLLIMFQVTVSVSVIHDNVL